MRNFGAASALMACSLLALSTPLAAQLDSGTWAIQPEGDLSSTLDCFEAEGKTLISGHRGGPEPGLPENSIEAMDALLAAAPTIMEVDVAASSDGTLYLMHDRTLDRTTTGTGRADERDWAYISELKLRDEAGWVTPYKVPTLAKTLEWAKGRTVLQIDFKRSAPYEDVITMIRETGNAQNVILIAYSVAAAAKMHALGPEMMISLSVEKPADLAEAEAAGIPRENIIAFTGIRLPKPELYRMLDEVDVEVIFGTLGGPNSLDNLFDKYGIDARYAELGQQGVDVIASDRPRAAAQVLAEAGRLPVAGQCGVSRKAP